MSLVPVGTLAKQALTETRLFLGFVSRLVHLSDAIATASATIEKHAAEIEGLKEQVRHLQADSARQDARLEAIAVGAAARVTNDLSRRIGFLKGRASRDGDHERKL